MSVGRGLVAVCAATVVVWSGSLVVSPAMAAQPAAGSDPEVGRSVPVEPLGAWSRSLPEMPQYNPVEPVWPEPASTVVEVPDGRAGLSRSGAATVGGLPVRVEAAGEEPSRVRVEVLGREAVQRLGSPLAVRVARADGRSGSAAVEVEVDYSAFRSAFGADWGWRVRLVRLPECALAPATLFGCGAVQPLPSSVDGETGRVSAVVELPGDVRAAPVAGADGGSVLVGLMATGSSTETGDFTRTDLTRSSSWSAGGNSGDFTWSYPIGVPPVPGDLVPTVQVGYSSGAVDGQTAGGNTQPSELGEGWFYSPGWVERTYRPCNDDIENSPVWPQLNDKPDLCWRLANAQVMLGGKSSEIVVGDDGVWRLADGNGERVELLTGADNRDNDGEHWRITTTDGTQYWFGRHELPNGKGSTGSTAAVPVFANHSGEPCLGATVAGSRCQQVYRWMLDYVVDANGNEMSFWYSTETNLTAVNLTTQSVSYDRALHLERIEYGTRVGQRASTKAPARVVFTNSDRCLGSCWISSGVPRTQNWPDTPWDLRCTASPCGNSVAPSFWSAKRLTGIRTEVLVGGAYQPVDQWEVQHQFPNPGDDTSPVLWLAKIIRTGQVGGSEALPALVTHGTAVQNRADYDADATMASHRKFRVARMVTESGGEVEVSYAGPGTGCVFGGSFPDPDSNGKRCFPQEYTNPSGQTGFSWWHKLPVVQVVERDLVGGSPPIVHDYGYSTAASSTGVLWRHGDGAAVWGSSLEHRSWSDWRGYTNVTVRSSPSGGLRSRVDYLYLRGLDGDISDSGPRSVTVTDFDAQQWTDSLGVAGRLLQTRTYDQDGGQPVQMTRSEPFEQVTGTRTLTTDWAVPNVHRSYLTRVASQVRWEWVDGAWSSRSVVDNTWDGTYGRLLSVSDSGADGSTAADDTCTSYEYVTSPHGSLLRFDGEAGGGRFVDTAVQVGSGWDGYREVWAAGDFDNDGNADLMGRQHNGRVRLHRGDGAGGVLSPSVLAGSGFADVDALFSPGDFNGDGKPDLIVRRGDATLWLYRGNGANGFSSTVRIGTGWHNFDLLFGPGDLNGDGHADVAGRLPDGTLVIYGGNGGTGFVGSWTMGTGWHQFDQLFSPGDMDGDGNSDVIGRNRFTGELRLYRGTGTAASSFHSPVTVGGGQISHGSEIIFSPGDFTGDGVPDLLARSLFLVDRVGRQVSTAGDCSTTPTLPDDLLADTRYHYDGLGFGTRPGRGNPTSTEVYGDGGWVTAVEAAYDGRGRVTSVTDALDRQTSTSYVDNGDGLTGSVTVTNPAGHQTTVDLDVRRGAALSVTDPNSRVTTGSYDPLGRLTAVTRPGNDSGTPDAQYAYTLRQDEPSHVETRLLGPDGQELVSYDIYDGLLRPRQSQQTAPDGNRTISDIRYDQRGMAATESVFYNDTSGPTADLATYDDADVEVQTRSVYDGRGRLTGSQLWSLDVLKHETTTVYEWDRTAVIPPDGGVVTQDIVDDRGRVVEKRQYHGPDLQGSYQATDYGYSLRGELVSVADPAGNQWSYDYDLLGRRVEAVDPDAGTSTFAYDHAGQMTSSIDGRGQKLFYTYDDLGRMTHKRADNAFGPLLAEWLYDTYLPGQLTETVRHHDGQEYVTRVTARDEAYRPLSTEVVIPAVEGALAGTYTFDATYRDNGAPDTQTLPAAGGLPAETLTFTYNGAGLPQTMTSGLGTYVADTAYQWDGKVAQQLLGQSGAQVRLTSSFEPATRRLADAVVQVENQTTPGTFDTVAEDTYAYDPAGNVVSVTDQQAGQAQCFEYDQLRRLVEAWTTTSVACAAGPSSAVVDGPDPYWHSWGFDQVGNRLTQTVHPTAAGGDEIATAYTYPAAGGPQPHTLTQRAVTDPAGTVVVGYDYDPAGNTVSRPGDNGQQTLTWDAEGHLATVTDTTGTADYVYDADGGRLLAHHGDGSATLYLPGGVELVADPVGLLSCRRYYGGVAVRTTADGLTWLAADHHGTGTRAIDADTLQVTQRRTDPYGNPRGQVTGGTWPDDKGFLGAPADPTGLTHLGAREYDPLIGRFISVDPVMLLTDPQQMHGYAYANNNPATWADPTGLFTACAPDADNLCPDQPAQNQDVADGPPIPSNCQSYSSCANPGAPGEDTTGLPGGSGSRGSGPIVEETLDHGTEYVLETDGTIILNGWQLPPGAPPSAQLAPLVDQLLFETDGMDSDDVYLIIVMICEEGRIKCNSEFRRAVWGASLAHDHGAASFTEVAAALTGMSILALFPGLTGGRVGGRTGSCRNSFETSTLVLMADGTTKPIEDVQPGDLVLATDPETGRTTPQPVTATITSNGTKAIVEVSITTDDHADEAAGSPVTREPATVTATSNHPFWIVNQTSWARADDLQPDDQLLTVDGYGVSIATVHARHMMLAVHNLTVDDMHTYYVLAGDTPVLVHNTPPGGCRITSSADSPTIPSKTVWTNSTRTIRVDVENPSPGTPGSAGVHVQFMGRGADPTKYYYSPGSGSWVSGQGKVLSPKIARQIPQSAIDKANKYLGVG